MLRALYPLSIMSKPLTLIFEAHGTTFDNEAHLSSGWNDVAPNGRSFGDRFPLIRDKRLRECDYGDLTQKPSEIVDAEKARRIAEPFPGGESYTETTARMKSFLDDLRRDYAGKRVMVIGHRATQYGIEQCLLGVPLEKLVATHFKWQPGWVYEVK